MADISPYDGPIIPLDSAPPSTPVSVSSSATGPTAGPSTLSPYNGPIIPLGGVEKEPDRGFVQGLRDWADKTDDLKATAAKYANGPEWYQHNIAPVIALPEAISDKVMATGARGIASMVQGSEDFADVATQKDDPHTRALNAQIAAGHLPEDIGNAFSAGATPFSPADVSDALARKSLLAQVSKREAEFPGAATAVPKYPEAQQRLQDFDQSGITPTLPAITQNHTLGNIANVTKEVPVLGEPITAAAKQQVSQAEQRSKDIADTFGEAASPKAGGEALQQGYQQFKYGPTGEPNPPPILKQADIFKPTRDVGFVPKSQALYEAIPIDKATTANVSNTTAKLADLYNQFPSNPELNSILATPTFGKLHGAIRPGFTEVASDSPYLTPTGAGFATGESAPQISFGDSGFSLTPGGKPAIAQTEPGFAAVDMTQLNPTGGMSWGDLKNFRSYAGRQMRQPSDQLGLGPDAWKALYGAASEDMRNTAADQGPDAIKAFNRANGYYAAGLQRLNDAMGFVSKATSDEAGFNALIAKGADRGRSADLARFQATMKSLPPEMKGDVASAMINRLGQPVASQADIGPFSIATWATKYNTLSPEAKDAVFGTTGTQQRDDLEALSRSIAALKGVDRLGNPSGSARHAITAGSLLGTGAGLVANPVATILGAVGGGGTTYGAAKLLTSPGMARWIANSTKVGTQAGWDNQMMRLGQLAKRNPGVIAPFYSTLMNGDNGPDQPTGLSQK